MGGAFVSHVTEDVRAEMRRPRRINWWTAIPMLSVTSVWSAWVKALLSAWGCRYVSVVY